MAKLQRNETLRSEFLELQATLATDFDALTDRVIEQALNVKAGEAEERCERGTVKGSPGLLDTHMWLCWLLSGG